MWLVVEMRNLGIFRWFLDAFASWMRVYLSLVKKVPKMGLFLAFFILCYLSLFYSGCHLMVKYMLFVMGFGVVVWLLLPIWCICLFEYWHYCSGAVVMNIDWEYLYSSRGAREERECKWEKRMRELDYTVGLCCCLYRAYCCWV